MKAPLGIAIATLLCCACVSGQLDPFRLAMSKRIFTKGETPIHKGMLAMGRNNPELIWSVVDPSPPSTVVDPARLTLPFDCVGDIVPISSSLALVCGHDSRTSTGHVALVFLDFPTAQHVLVLRQVITLGQGTDPLGISWVPSDGRLYVLDAVAKHIKSVVWGGLQSPTPAIPPYSEWELVCDTASVAALNAPLRLALDNNQGQNCEVVTSQTDLRPYHPSWSIAKIHGVWQVSRSCPSIGADAPLRILVREWDIVSARHPLTIMGPAGHFSIVDGFTGATAYSGVLPSADTWHAFRIPQELTAGHPFDVRVAGSSTPSRIWPLVRYGAPQQEDGIRIGWAHTQPAACVVGNGRFGFVADVRFDPKPAAPLSYVADLYVSIGFRAANGVDPIFETSELGAAILNPSTILGPEPTVVSSGEITQPLACVLPLPDDPSLEGNVLLWQFLCTTPNGLVCVSDVAGCTIGAATQGSDMAARGPSALLRPTPPTRSRVLRSQRLLGSLENGELTESGRWRFSALMSVLVPGWQRR